MASLIFGGSDVTSGAAAAGASASVASGIASAVSRAAAVSSGDGGEGGSTPAASGVTGAVSPVVAASGGAASGAVASAVLGAGVVPNPSASMSFESWAAPPPSSIFAVSTLTRASYLVCCSLILAAFFMSSGRPVWRASICTLAFSILAKPSASSPRSLTTLSSLAISSGSAPLSIASSRFLTATLFCPSRTLCNCTCGSTTSATGASTSASGVGCENWSTLRVLFTRVSKPRAPRVASSFCKSACVRPRAIRLSASWMPRAEPAIPDGKPIAPPTPAPKTPPIAEAVPTSPRLKSSRSPSCLSRSCVAVLTIASCPADMPASDSAALPVPDSAPRSTGADLPATYAARPAVAPAL